MPAATQASVSACLSATHRPDREYVDGEIVERNLGEYEHGRPQARFVIFSRIFYTAEGMREAKDGTSHPELAVPLSALFD